MNTEKQLGMNVRIMRAKLGASQAQVAKSAQLSQAYVGKIERGQGNVTVAVLDKLAKALGTTPKQLLSQIELDTHAA